MSQEVSGPASGPPAPRGERGTLAATLLHGAVSEDRRRWAYRPWLIGLLSVAVAYHCMVLLVDNLPAQGLAKGLQESFKKGLQMHTYMEATGNAQSWGMFAPDPQRSNVFMRVLVKDRAGEVWDLAHDIYGKRSYPYLFYDRMGKINRRIADQKEYRRPYAAWVCRWWEQVHDGESADEVRFVIAWTLIPSPAEVIRRARGDVRRMGYDPGKLHLHQREEEAIACRTTRNAQLPNYLRDRYGIPRAAEDHFQPVHQPTWWDRKRNNAR